jgi:hypothetical protein
MVTESQLKTKAKKAIREEFPTALVMAIEDLFHVGYPDWLIILNGRHVFIEWKLPGKKLQPMQIFTAEMIHYAGGEMVKCESVSEVLKILREEVS